MARKLISSGSEFEKTAGYSRAVVDGDWVFVAGTTGFDYEKMTIPYGLEEQVHQTFRNIEAALAEAGASLKDVVRANYIVPQSADWPRITPILGRYFRRHPAGIDRHLRRARRFPHAHRDRGDRASAGGHAEDAGEAQAGGIKAKAQGGAAQEMTACRP